MSLVFRWAMLHPAPITSWLNYIQITRRDRDAPCLTDVIVPVRLTSCGPADSRDVRGTPTARRFNVRGRSCRVPFDLLSRCGLYQTGVPL